MQGTELWYSGWHTIISTRDILYMETLLFHQFPQQQLCWNTTRSTLDIALQLVQNNYEGEAMKGNKRRSARGRQSS